MASLARNSLMTDLGLIFNTHIIYMKRFVLFCLTLCATLVLHAQDVPYSKYLNFSSEEFKENHFKYDEETNTWSLRKKNGLRIAANVLAILADGVEDVRPSSKDYAIAIQMGKENQASFVKVKFYSDETYHKLLTFLKDNGKDLVETSSGKLIKHQAFCDDYSLELNMETHNITRTSSQTSWGVVDSKARKTIDQSYNEYQFFIHTDVQPWSPYLDRKAAKQAKRDAKGKKKKSVDDLM